MWCRKKKTRPAPWLSLPSAVLNAAKKNVLGIQYPRTVRRVSKRRAELNRKYHAAIDTFRAMAPENRVCYRCRMERRVLNTKITNHHIRGRLGKLLCDTRWFMSLCLTCHNFVHDNPMKASELGYIDLVNWNKWEP